VLKTLPDSVVAMTACEVAKAPHAQLDRIFRESYHVARLFWASTRLSMHRFSAIRRMHDADQPNIVQEVIAQRIISMARNGEDNRDRLCAGALKGART
jgi:CRP-like cAMP-binding protein